MAKKKSVNSIDRKDYLICMGRVDGSLEGAGYGAGYGVQLLPAVFFTCCVFLISRMVQGPSAYAELGDLYYMTDSQTTTDFYFYWKAIAVYICAAIALACFGYRALTGTLWARRSRLYLPLAIYLGLAFLSFCFSEYRGIAWFGTDGLYGGAAVILCCGFMFFYIFNSVTDERSVKWFVWPLTICLLMASALGVTQAAGRDFLKTAAGQKLLVPNIETVSGERAWDIIDSFAAQGRTALEFIFDRDVYQTVGNPNYVALYTPLVLPLFAFLFLRESRPSRRIVWAAAFGLILFNLFASQSSGAVVGAVVVLIACVPLSGRRLLSLSGFPKRPGFSKTKFALAVIVIICALLNFQTLAGGVAKNILESVGAERTPGVIGEMAEGAVDVSDLEQYKKPAYSRHTISSIVTKDDRVEITIDGDSFALTDDPAPYASADDPASIAPAGDTDLLVSAYNPDSLAPAPDYVIVSYDELQNGVTVVTMQIEAEVRSWRFVKTPDGYRYINDLGKLVRLRDVERVGNDRHLFLGTGRVYIWSRTLPLLKDTILLGRGPDTFMLYFPQDDYVGRYNGSWDLRAVVDKPHNLYLNIAFGSGVLSLAAFLAFIYLYLLWSFRLYRASDKRDAGRRDTREPSPGTECRDTKEPSPCTEGRSAKEPPPGVMPLADTVGRGIFAGVCGFLAAGMFYDGVTSVMPLFWGLLALGAASNRICELRKR